MSKKEIKGMNIKFTSDTSGLSKALKEININSSQLSRELKQVNNLLKLDPHNTELLAQKQRILSENISVTSEKLQKLKNSQEEINRLYQNGDIGEKKYREFNREIEKTESQLEQLEKQLKSINQIDFKKLQGQIGNVGSTLTRNISVPLIGITSLGTKFALDFESALAKVNTILDTTKMPLEKLKNMISELSDVTGVSVVDISEAVYQAISAGIDSANVIDIVSIAIKDAKGGFTDTATAIDGLTTVLNSYNLETKYASTISDQFLITQNKGKTTFGEIASSIGKVSPIAANLKIGLDELLSSVASLTANGIATAESITGLKAAFSNIVKPTAEAQKEAKNLGIEFNNSALQSKGWLGFLEDIKQKTGGSIDKMSKLFGSTEAVNTILSLTSEKGIKIFNESLEEMRKQSSATDEAFNKMSDTTSNKAQITFNSLKNSAASFFDSLLPSIDNVLKKGKAVINGFNKLNPATKATILTLSGLALAIGPLLILLKKIIGVITVIQGLSLTSGLGILLTAIGFLTGGVIAFKNATDQTKEKLLNLNDTFKTTDEVLEETNKKFEEIEQSSKESFDRISNNFLKTLSTMANNVSASKLTENWKTLLSQYEETLDVHKQNIIAKYTELENNILNSKMYTDTERLELLTKLHDKEKSELDRLQTIYDKALTEFYKITGEKGEKMSKLASEDYAKISLLYKDLVDELGTLGADFDPTLLSAELSEKAQDVVKKIKEKVLSGGRLSNDEIEEYKTTMLDEVKSIIETVDDEIANQKLLSETGIISPEASQKSIEQLENIKNECQTKIQQDIDFLLNKLPELVNNSSAWQGTSNFKNPWEPIFEFSDDKKEQVKNESKAIIEAYANNLGTAVIETKNKFKTYGKEIGQYLKTGTNEELDIRDNISLSLKSTGEKTFNGFQIGNSFTKYYDLGINNSKAYTKGFTKGLDIHSPSKKMNVYGKNTFQGFANASSNIQYSLQGSQNALSYLSSFTEEIKNHRMSLSRLEYPKYHNQISTINNSKKLDVNLNYQSSGNVDIDAVKMADKVTSILARRW